MDDDVGWGWDMRCNVGDAFFLNTLAPALHPLNIPCQDCTSILLKMRQWWVGHGEACGRYLESSERGSGQMWVAFICRPM